MSVDATRRSMLGLGLAAAAGLASPSIVAGASARPGAFVGQSGDPQGGAFFLGLLSTPDVAALRAEVAAIRVETRYRRALRSRSTDRFRIAYARALIDHLAGQKETRFSALEVALSSWPAPGPRRDLMVRSVARELFAVAPGASPVVMVDNRAPWSFGHLARVAGVTDASGAPLGYGLVGSDDLLQIAEFLTGLASAGGQRNSRSGRSEMAGYLAQRLDVGEIASRALAHHPVFRIRRIEI